MIFRTGRGFDFIEAPAGLVVGAMPDTQFELRKTYLKNGDIVFMYTDGVTEATNSQNVMFSKERLQRSLSNLVDKNVTTVVHGIGAEIEAFTRGTPQSDDLTMLALKFHGKAGSGGDRDSTTISYDPAA